MAAEPRSHLITRDGLIARLSRAAPRIVAAFAPAGYGKSTTMRAFASTFASASTCDCLGIESPADFARELSSALVRGDAERTAAFAQQQLVASTDENLWSEFAEQWCASPGGPDLLVFENVERIIDSVENLEFLARILSRAPQARKVGICSRRPLPVSLTRFVAPHELVVFRADDLRFDSEEIARVFSESNPTPEALMRISELTRGWPIAVLLFARLARERSLLEILSDVKAVRFDELHEYLAEQVVDSLTPAQLDQLIAVAAIPKATAQEVAIATGDASAVSAVPDLARSSPLLYSIADGSFEVHPMVAEMLWKRFAGECASTLRRTADSLRDVDRLRAAQLYLHADDQDTAASMLEDATSLWFADSPQRFAEIVSQLDANVIVRYPGVWGSATSVRATTVPHKQWLHEALLVRDNLNPGLPVDVQLGVLTSLVNVLTNVGRHDEALRVLEDFATAQAELPPPALGVIEFVRACIYARRGQFSAALASWSKAEPIFAEVKFTRAIATEEITVRAARYRGDRNAERGANDLAVSLARESGTALAVALTLEEAAFAAWFAGEDRLFQRYVTELDASVAPTTRRATEVFRACARGELEPLRRSEGVEHPKIRCYAALIACGNADAGARAEAARHALSAAEESAEPALVAMSCIAVAECDADERETMLKQAATAAAQVEYGVVAGAVDSYARGDADCGLFAAFVQRLRTKIFAVLQTPQPEYVMLLRSGRLYRGDRAVALSGRELELLAFIASRNRACTSEEIVEALWPERSLEDSTILRVSIARVRSKLADRDVIISDSGSYRLGPYVTSDVAEIEHALREGRQSWPLTTAGRAKLQSCFERFCASPAVVPDWLWFGSSASRLEELTREVSMLLARDALEASERARARHFAMRIIDDDPCDEPARELLIRSYLADGDRTSALREFRTYREVLAKELDAEPSADITALVQSSVTVRLK